MDVLALTNAGISGGHLAGVFIVSRLVYLMIVVGLLVAMYRFLNR
ncbi:hypothetical protein [Antrihabitans cavernicola]|nr:hypothetical protein [Spelaeibacter cavernicola]